MTKKTRLIILLFCIVCFLLIAPILVAYSMGYRFDFDKDKIVATGGIYVRSFPAADQIIVDSGIAEKPGLFGSSVFVQSLLPKNHTVSIKKSGYYDYYKTLPVLENQVTKIENVLLIKKNIKFTDISEKIDYFSIAPNNQNIITATYSTKSTTFEYFSLNSKNTPKTFSVPVAGTLENIKWSDDSNEALIDVKTAINDYYYLFNSTLQKPSATRLSYLDKTSQQIYFSQQNSESILYIKNQKLYSAKGNVSLPIISNVISFRISGTNITWLSSKGVLSNSDFSGKLVNAITLKNFPVDNKKIYKIISLYGTTFLQEDSALFELNPTTKIFELVEVPLTNYKILTSGDGKNLIYWNPEKIYLYSLETKKFAQLFSGSQITACQWFNNDYIIFTSGDKVIISEIDYRGNINSIALPQAFNSPQMFFNPSDNKIYVLNQKTLSSSEKITP